MGLPEPDGDFEAAAKRLTEGRLQGGRSAGRRTRQTGACTDPLLFV